MQNQTITTTTTKRTGSSRSARRRRARALQKETKTVVVQVPTSKARKPRRNRRNRSGANNQVHLSSCASNYLLATISPFAFFDYPQDELPCIPRMPPVKSRKALMFARGTFSTNAAGKGGIFVRPYTWANNNTVALSLPGIVSTKSTWTDANGEAIPVWNVGGAAAGANVELNPGDWNSDYTLADLGSPAATSDKTKARTVGCGLRIRYIGTNLQLSGKTIGLVHPTHSPVSGMTEFSLLNYEQARSKPVSRKWTTLTLSPIDGDEMDYANDQDTSTLISSNADSGAIMGFGVTGCVSQTFDFEAVQLVEFSGMHVRGKTRTNTDPVGFSAVNAVVNSDTPPSMYGSVQNIIQAVKDNVAEATSAVGRAAVKTGLNLATATAVRYINGSPAYSLPSLQNSGVTITEIDDNISEILRVRGEKGEL